MRPQGTPPSGSDPTRLNDLRDEESAAERALLETSRGDAPPSGARNRALAALGVASGAAAITTTAAESVHHGLRLVSLLKVLGVIGGVFVAGLVAYEAEVRAPAHVDSSPRTALSAQVDTPMSVPTYVVSDTSPTPANSAVSSSSAQAVTKPHAPASSAKAISADAEIAWIDRAQAALATDPGKARRIVDAYRHDVSPRAYDEEATAIAAEASAKLGDHERATREAKTFLATYPTSAYRDRVQAILASP
ncbi:MAG: hypothetical protein ABI183_05060 [Polyangiaceae bacterium]